MLQSPYFMSVFYNIPYEAYVLYDTYEAKYEKINYEAKYEKIPEDGYYLLRRCIFNNTEIIEVQGGFKGGGGRFNFFDLTGNNTCNFQWSMDNCAQHGCTFSCPYVGRECSIILGNLKPDDILFE